MSTILSVSEYLCTLRLVRTHKFSEESHVRSSVNALKHSLNDYNDYTTKFNTALMPGCNMFECLGRNEVKQKNKKRLQHMILSIIIMRLVSLLAKSMHILKLEPIY